MKRINLNRFLLASLLFFSLILSGCIEDETKNAESADSATLNKQESIVNPQEKYDPPIDVTAVKFITEDVVYPSGQSDTENAWESLYKEMGINLKYDWIVKGTDAQYLQKLNVSIVSGDIPDLMMVNSSQLKQLVEADMIEDLTDVYKHYATPAVKNIFEQDPMALQSATFDGKLFAMPKTEPMIGAKTSVMWVRTDWLQALNLPTPTSWEDVLNTSKTFTKEDPDGNGKQDTLGLALSKDVVNGYPFLNGFFNAYGAFPAIWIEDDEGNLVYGSIQPEIKVALAQLAKMYKSGELDKDFGVKNASKVAESIVNDRVGLLFGPSWASQWPLQDNKKKNPSAEWRAYPIPSVNGGDASVQMPFGANYYFVVKKGYEHPEIVVKMANLFMEKLYGPSADYLKYGVDSQGITVAKFAFVDMVAPDKDLKRTQNVTDALMHSDPFSLNPEEKSTYDKIIAFSQGDLNFYGETYQNGPEGAMMVLKQLWDNGKIVSEGYGGAVTDTMGEKKATLEKMETEIFTKIIYGAIPIDQFDQFAQDWLKLGGEQITHEVNAWKAAQNK